MRETQENYYLVLFMFASQLYFYILGPSSLLCYQGFLFQLELGLVILYKQPIVLLENVVDILMNEKNVCLVSLWSGADSVLSQVLKPSGFSTWC